MAQHKPRLSIQQQMYTRERRGIFRSTEGYDTVAKSGGLDSSFVKKTLHPLCVYDAPAELTASGEKDSGAYPEAMHLLHLDQGDTLIGRSVYKEADFTGLRSTFFTHHYVIPSGYSDHADQDYRSWLSAAFEDNYSVDQGTELKELDRLPQAANGFVSVSARRLLSELKLDEKEFKALLYAVMASLGSKKKVYVTLDVPIRQLPDRAKELLAVLYSCLPHALRKSLGFLTYSKEPMSRKGIHLTFVESDSIRAGDREIEKEYVLDLANKRILNVDLDGLDQPYLNFVWANLDNGNEIEKFCQFAGVMLEGMGSERALAAASYHELCVMYEGIEGNESLLEQHQSAVLSSALPYLSTPDALDAKIALSDLLLSRFDLEYDKVSQGAIPDQAIVAIFIDYYGLVGKLIENKLVGFLIFAISNANKNGDQAAASSFYERVERDEVLGKAFFHKIISEPRFADSLFFPYLQEQLKTAPLRNIIPTIAIWGETYPKLYEYDQLSAIIHKLVNEKLTRERSLGAANSVFGQLNQLSDGAGVDTGARNLARELEHAVYQVLLKRLEPERLTRDELKQAAFLGDARKMRRWNDELRESNLAANARILLVLYHWLILKDSNMDLFDRLNAQELNRVQGIARGIFAEGLKEADFPELVTAYLRGSQLDMVDYDGLIDFLHEHSAQKETIYRFFLWTESNPHFLGGRGFVAAYKSAIIRYFKEYDRSAFKARDNWREYFNQSGEKLNAIFKQAQLELSSPLARLFRRNPKGTLIISIAGLGCILLLSGLLMSLGDKESTDPEKIEVPEVTSTPTPSPSIDPGPAEKPEMIVYVEQAEATEGQEGTTSVMFLLKDEEACALFAPKSLRIQEPLKEVMTYSELKLTPACTVQSATPDTTIAPDSSTPAEGEIDEIEAEGSTSSSAGQDQDQNASEVPSDGTDVSKESSESDRYEEYIYRVAVDLGQQVDIPVNSLIWVDDSEVAWVVKDDVN